MQINPKTAKQFLDALNDYVSNGDMEIAAVTAVEAGGMCRTEMNIFLFELFEENLKLKEKTK